MNAQLANLSFLVLLCSMICYWIGPLSRDLFAVGTYSEKTKSMSSISQQRYAGISENTISLDQPDSFLGKLTKNVRLQMESLKITFTISNSLQVMGRTGIILSNILLVILLSNRWRESGHFPLSNLYESLMFLSWSFTLIHLFIENLTNSKTASNPNVGKFIGAITTPSALFTNAFATFTLPKEMQGSSSLVPALQSNWLMMHVTVMIISYAALILGSILSIAYLIITVQRQSPLMTQNVNSSLDSNNQRVLQPNTDDVSNIYKSTLDQSYISGSTSKDESSKDNNINRKNNSQNLFDSVALTLDNLSYRILGIGFPFLTIGILSGAVWANEAWGSYWSWDPKETWAFLTWLVYAIYLHTRLNKGWEGKKPAIIASLGFIVTWICYLGVNLIGEGLHSYGWLSS